MLNGVIHRRIAPGCISTLTLAFSDSSMRVANQNSTVERKGGIATLREKDKHGRETGHAFYRCTACGAEIMTSWGRDHLPHEGDCPISTEGDR